MYDDISGQSPIRESCRILSRRIFDAYQIASCFGSVSTKAAPAYVAQNLSDMLSRMLRYTRTDYVASVNLHTKKWHIRSTSRMGLLDRVVHNLCAVFIGILVCAVRALAMLFAMVISLIALLQLDLVFFAVVATSAIVVRSIFLPIVWMLQMNCYIARNVFLCVKDAMMGRRAGASELRTAREFDYDETYSDKNKKCSQSKRIIANFYAALFAVIAFICTIPAALVAVTALVISLCTFVKNICLEQLQAFFDAKRTKLNQINNRVRCQGQDEDSETFGQIIKQEIQNFLDETESTSSTHDSPAQCDAQSMTDDFAEDYWDSEFGETTEDHYISHQTMIAHSAGSQHITLYELHLALETPHNAHTRT